MRSRNKKVLLFLGVLLVLTTTSVLFYWRQARDFAQRTYCVGNLVNLKMAKTFGEQDLKLKEGDVVPEAELNKNLSKPLNQYRCPKGGSYIVGAIGVTPECTYTNVCHTYSLDGFKLVRRTWWHSLTAKDY